MKRYLGLYDIHYPTTDKPTLKALLKFMADNKIDGVVMGGDQFDNACISPHNANKPLYKETAAYHKETVGFDKEILVPIEKQLEAKADKVWIIGNHDDWEHQLIERQPELKDTIERQHLLDLDDRGWKVIPCGKTYKVGKLTFLHGETLTGVGNQASQYHAKKAVDSFNCNVLYGHLHSPQSYTKILPHDETQKFMAYCSPILGDVNPNYLRNRPTAWLNGFTLVEFHDNGNFNVYPIVVTNGQFSYAGKIYKG